MRRLILGMLIALAMAAIPHGAQAAAALKIAPLQYRANIPVDQIQSGVVDVSNPSDGQVEVIAEVQAFRQVDQQGNLQFYDDEALKKAVAIDISNFKLGPREAARISFRLDPRQVGRSGIYGALLFRTAAIDTRGNISTIQSSARVGTLLIIQAGEGTQRGQITAARTPLVQFGNALRTNLDYRNVTSDAKAVAFNPSLKIKGGFWGGAQRSDAGLVMPGTTRAIDASRTGNYLGLTPIKIQDQSAENRPAITTWTFAVTGYWRWLAPTIMALAILSVVGARRRQLIWGWLQAHRPRTWRV